jgi:transcriptional regulator with PAS, ATPase and Fis domain
MDRFQMTTTMIFNNQRPSAKPNTTKAQKEILQELLNDSSVIVTATDKNLGPAVIDKQTYVDRALQDHLLNEKTYRQLTKQEAATHQVETKKEIYNLVQDVERARPRHYTSVFLRRAYPHPNKKQRRNAQRR